MKKILLLVPVLILLVIVAVPCCFVVSATEQVVVTSFGKPVGEPITTPGLHFKVPFTQSVHRFDKRVLEWNGNPVEITTKDKFYLEVDTFARWKLVDLTKFFVRIRDERSAESRITDILGSSTRAVVAQHELVELIRSTPDRKVDPSAGTPMTTSAAAGAGTSAPPAVMQLPAIKLGRKGIEKLIVEAARGALLEYGVELIDLRFKRLNYDNQVAQKINERMISERRQLAERFRSEGAAMAARIMGDRERDLQKIESEAYREVQKIRGEADAKATEIYSKAFNQSPDAAEFYAFSKSLDTYENSMPPGTTLMFSTDAEIFRYLKSSDAKVVVPTPVAAPVAPASPAAPKQEIAPAVPVSAAPLQ